jgi:hypothetical protein
MKRIAIAGLLLCVAVLVGRLFAHAGYTNNFVSVFVDSDGGGITEVFSGQVLTNTTDADGQTFTLTDCIVGTDLIFSCAVAQNIIINPDNNDRILGLTSHNGDSITANAIGASVRLVKIDATNWLPVNVVGTWSDSN